MDSLSRKKGIGEYFIKYISEKLDEYTHKLFLHAIAYEQPEMQLNLIKLYERCGYKCVNGSNEMIYQKKHKFIQSKL